MATDQALSTRVADLRLTAYRPADADRVRALHIASFQALAGDVHDLRQIAAHVELIEASDYADELAGSHVALAFDAAGELVASAGWMPHSEGTARIRKVFVHPSMARRGIASFMVEDAERRAKAEGFDKLFVRANLNAVPLYERLGYQRLEAGAMATPAGIDLPVVYMKKG